MTSRSISIKEDVYNLLDKYRLKNESFSQTIKRLLESNTNIMEFAGAWKKIPDVEPALDLLKKVIKKVHEQEGEKIHLI